MQKSNSNRPAGIVEGGNVTIANKPVSLPLPNSVHGGKLTLRKENGAVKGFEYCCVCGHRDYFVCE